MEFQEKPAPRRRIDEGPRAWSPVQNGDQSFACIAVCHQVQHPSRSFDPLRLRVVMAAEKRAATTQSKTPETKKQRSDATPVEKPQQTSTTLSSPFPAHKRPTPSECRVRDMTLLIHRVTLPAAAARHTGDVDSATTERMQVGWSI